MRAGAGAGGGVSSSTFGATPLWELMRLWSVSGDCVRFGEVPCSHEPSI